MKILNDNDIHLKFLMGLPIYIEGIGNFHAPYLTEIVDLTEEIYNMSLSTVFFDKSQLEGQFDMEKYSNFQVLCSIIIEDENYRELFFYALGLHLDTPPIFHTEGIIYFDELSEESILTEEKFEYIKRLVKIANNLSDLNKEEEEYKAGNERARKFMERLKKQRAEEEKLRNLKKPKINLHSIISAVGWKSQSFKFISELNIYQLYNGLDRLNIIDNYTYNMFGIYNGKIDGAKIKLDDIYWANSINKK